MEQALEYISTYGYLAVFIGTVVWGETIMIAAGFLASLPNLNFNLGLVMLFGAIGTITADSFWYLVGHSGKKGSRFLEKYEKFALLKPKFLDKIKDHFNNHEGKTVFFSKFIYGTRTIVLITAGAAGMKYSKFLFYNFLSIIFWAVGMAFVGYFLGEGFLQIKDYVKGAEYILLGIVVLFIVIRIAYAFYKKQKQPKEETNAIS